MGEVGQAAVQIGQALQQPLEFLERVLVAADALEGAIRPDADAGDADQVVDERAGGAVVTADARDGEVVVGRLLELRPGLEASGFGSERPPVNGR